MQQQGRYHTRIESLMELAYAACALAGVCLFAAAVTLQEEQRAERQAAKAALQQLSVRDKTTFASRQQALFADDTIRTVFHETLKASKKVCIMPGVCGCMLFALACSSRELGGNFTQTAAGSVRKTKQPLHSMMHSWHAWLPNNTVCAAGHAGYPTVSTTVCAARHGLRLAQMPPVDPDASLAAAAVAAVPRRVARENIKELLAKKRETLLVQMSLDTKRAEIRKLQVCARIECCHMHLRFSVLGALEVRRTQCTQPHARPPKPWRNKQGLAVMSGLSCAGLRVCRSVPGSEKRH